MYKILYLPTAEAVYIERCLCFSKENLQRYINSPSFCFYKTDYYGICCTGLGSQTTIDLTNRIIPKHLFEIVED